MMTRPTMRPAGAKAAIAALAILCAGVALAILGTATPVGGAADATFLGAGHLER